MSSKAMKFDPMRLACAAKRIEKCDETLDRDYFRKGALSRIIMDRDTPPARTMRMLVEAELVAPNDRLACRLNDLPERGQEEGLMSREGMSFFAERQLARIFETSGSRDVMIATAALRKHVSDKNFGHEQALVGFERITRGAEQAGAEKSADLAAVAFARIARAAHAQREQEMWKGRADRGIERE